MILSQDHIALVLWLAQKNGIFEEIKMTIKSLLLTGLLLMGMGRTNASWLESAIAIEEFAVLTFFDIGCGMLNLTRTKDRTDVFWKWTAIGMLTHQIVSIPLFAYIVDMRNKAAEQKKQAEYQKQNAALCYYQKNKLNREKASLIEQLQRHQGELSNLEKSNPINLFNCFFSKKYTQRTEELAKQIEQEKKELSTIQYKLNSLT